MKISKVDHTNTAVGIQENNSKGILYNNPSANGISVYSNQDLVDRVKKLNESAKRLYSVFNNVSKYSFNPTKDEVNAWNAIKKDVNSAVKEFSSVKKELLPSYIKSLEVRPKPYTRKLIEVVCSVDEIPSFIKKFVNESVRKSYCTPVKSSTSDELLNLKEVIEKFTLGIVLSKKYTKIMSSVSNEALAAFVKVWDEDYNKDKQLDLIVKSISKKDTKVQTVNNGTERCLALSSYQIEKKKPLFEFMIEYSSSDDVKRENLRNEKRKFISDYLLSGNSDGIVFSEQLEDKLKMAGSTLDKNERKKIKAEALVMLSEELLHKYNDTKARLNSDDAQGLYWLYFFSSETEKWVKEEIKKRNGDSYNVEGRKLAIADLSKHLYKYFLSFLAEKYIDMGKAVYHFTDFEGKNVGQIKDCFKNGISSFDYERITADDNVKRDMATYVSFAVNNFANSVCDADVLCQDKYEDVLGIKLSEEDKFRDDAKMLILRYFGGISKWDSIKNVGKMEMVSAFREMLASVRNSTIHFDASFSEGRAENNSRLVKKMFEEEYRNLGKMYAQKYYSNNLPMFYKKETIYELINHLYSKEREILAGVPSFGRIVARSKANDFIKAWIGIDEVNRIESISPEMQEKYIAAMYFLLKEVYYYGFLADNTLQRYLDYALKKMKPKEIRNDKGKVLNSAEVNPYRNFEKRYNALRNSGMRAAEICEQIMHDFAEQNNEIKEVKVSKNASADDPEIYQHFRMLLYELIRRAFLSYLSNEKYASFKKPSNLEETFKNLSVEDFAKGVEVNVCKSVTDTIQNPEFLAWYATAHFMSKKHINHLCGDIRTEIKYLKDIDRRAYNTGNRVDKNTKKRTAYYTKLLRVLEFTMNFCEVTTNNILDYFSSMDEYAKKVAYFVEYSDTGRNTSSELIEFCNRKTELTKSGVIGIYYDATNPIVNKNVVRATMYGRDSLFENEFVEKVTEDSIQEYYEVKKKIESIFSGDVQKSENATVIRSEQEQISVREFQNLKNRVELTNISAYVDLVTELYSQLLSWIYLRERDMTYMQLGYHYVRLFWGNGLVEANEQELHDGQNRNIEKGAILYMLKAAYSHDMKMPTTCKKAGVNGFLEMYDIGTYYAGMELFENITVRNGKIIDDAIHDEVQALRNYIAHFKYFSKVDHSMEELYGDVFSLMFAYNPNLRKSVPFVFKNILAQNMLIADIEAMESESTPYFRKTKDVGYSNIKWVIKRDVTVDIINEKKTFKGLDSDILTFKVSDNNMKKQIKLPAHDQKFLDDVRRIYCYKKR